MDSRGHLYVVLNSSDVPFVCDERGRCLTAPLKRKISKTLQVEGPFKFGDERLALPHSIHAVMRDGTKQEEVWIECLELEHGSDAGARRYDGNAIGVFDTDGSWLRRVVLQTPGMERKAAERLAIEAKISGKTAGDFQLTCEGECLRVCSLIVL